MSSSQESSALPNDAEDEGAGIDKSRQREEFQGVADDVENVVSLPTVDECENQMSSIFNSRSVTDTMCRPQKEDTGQKPNTTSPRQLKNNRFATPNKPNQSTMMNDPARPFTRNIQIIGSGSDVFDIKISIEKHHDLHQLLSLRNTNTPSDAIPKRNVWLSYRCFGAVVQSEIFTISKVSQQIDDFTPVMNTFSIQGSLAEFAEYFNERKNASLRIYLCTEGEVICTSFVDLRQLFTVGQGYNPGRHRDFEGRMIRNEYVLQPRTANSTSKEGNGGESLPYSVSSPRLTIRLCIDLNPSSESSLRIGDSLTSKCQKLDGCEQRLSPAAQYSSVSSQTMEPTGVVRASSPRKDSASPDDDHGRGGDSHVFNQLEEREKQLKAREAELTKKEKGMYEAFTSLEKKRCEWEQWRHQKELEWHRELRNKEAAMMRIVEERVCTIEKERLSSMEASQSEYQKLEARLRKALIEVEAKERQLKDIELGHQNERKRKLAEIELREKLMKQELKHTLEIERAKVNVAVGQAVVAEKSATVAGKKVKHIEAEMDQLREQYRKTPEVTLMHQVAELKGQLADCERRAEAIKAEKSQVTAEKEQFRSNVHKLARALRKEREKSKAERESSNQQVRLIYDERGKSFVLDGGHDEIQRILTDLDKISQNKDQGSGYRSPMISPHMRKQHVVNNQHLPGGDDTTHNSYVPPMPSPTPSHPAAGDTHLNGACFSYGVNSPVAADNMDLGSMRGTTG